jgi:phosphohistidine phosphatase
MELYVIRHADAAQFGEGNIHADADRPLTQAGQDQSRAIATGLQRRGVNLQLILTSPLLRSRQTAEGMVKVWSGAAPEVKVCDELTPNTKPRKLARALRDLEHPAVAIIGHEPDLSAWVAWAIGTKKAHLALAKAGVAHLSCPDGPGKGEGTLMQLVTPEWFS